MKTICSINNSLVEYTLQTISIFNSIEVECLCVGRFRNAAHWNHFVATQRTYHRKVSTPVVY